MNFSDRFDKSKCRVECRALERLAKLSLTRVVGCATFFFSFGVLRSRVPVKIQSFLRDSGLLRLIVDTLTKTTAAPSIIREHPEAVARYLHFSGLPSPLVVMAETAWKSDRVDPQIPTFGDKIQLQKVRYGEHPRQFLELMKLDRERQPKTQINKEDSASRNLLVFVHGGAWGSGSPDIYRLVAGPFLSSGIDVAMLGYRTYPDAHAEEQVADVVASIKKLEDVGVVDHNTKVTLMGHSTGSHISSMALLTSQDMRDTVQYFVALSGVFDIPKHYQFERSRGVEVRRDVSLSSLFSPSVSPSTLCSSCAPSSSL